MTLGGVVVTVGGDGVVVEQRLVAGQLTCPGCAAVLAGWGHARLRSVRTSGGAIWVRPRRTRCSGCAATHVLLPAVLLLRRADTVAVIGAALVAKAAGLGHRRIAVRLGRPVSTVRGWLRRFEQRSAAVREWFTVLLRAVAPDPVMPDPGANEVADAVAAIVAAAAAATRRFVVNAPPWRWVSAVSSGRFLAPGWPPDRSTQVDSDGGRV